MTQWLFRVAVVTTLALTACKSAALPKADQTPAPEAALAAPSAPTPSAPAADPTPAAAPAPTGAAVAPATESKAAPATAEASARPAAAIKEPCRIAPKGNSAVAKACAEGGIPRAKAVMKAMVKQGRTAGASFECDDCHMDNNELTSDVKEKFAKLLAAQK